MNDQKLPRERIPECPPFFACCYRCNREADNKRLRAENEEYKRINRQLEGIIEEHEAAELGPT